MVPAGAPVQVTAFATNAQFLLVPGYTGTAALTSSDGSATSGGAALPANITFVNGQATFSVTFATSGAQSLTLTDSADSMSGTASTSVVTAPSPTPIPTPVAATQLALLLPSTVPSGVPIMVQAMAESASGNPVPSYAGTAALTSSDSGATSGGTALPANITFVNGKAMFLVTFATSGTQSLTLTDSADSIGGTASTSVMAVPSPTPIPIPTAPTQLVLLLPSTTVPSGAQVMVQAMAEDASGNPVPSFSGPATLTSSDSGATSGGAALPVNVTFTNGHATFPVTFATLGSQTLTLTNTADSLTGSLAVTVAAAPTPIPTPLPPPITQEQFVLLLPPTVPRGVAVTVHALLVGASAQSSWSYSGTAVLTSSDSNATSGGVALPVNVSFVHGQASFSVTFGTAGTQSLTLTDSADSLTGIASTMVGMPITTAPTHLMLLLPPTPAVGPASTVPEGALITIMAVAEDSDGNPTPSYSGTATLTIAGGTATLAKASLPATVTFVDGQAALPLDFTSLGTIVLTLTDVANPSLTGSIQVTVTSPPSGPAPLATSAG